MCSYNAHSATSTPQTPKSQRQQIWALFCDSCADAQELRYYYPRGKRMYFVSEDTEKTKFPAEVEGVTVCPHCSASDLVLVYDEVHLRLTPASFPPDPRPTPA